MTSPNTMQPGTASDEPELSVVMTARNAQSTILAAVQSILDQVRVNLELLVADDASNDGTWTLLEGLTDPRLRLFRHPSNLGAGPSRDALMRQARGRWIAFCDADDLWLPERASILLTAACNDHRAVVFDDIVMRREIEGEVVSREPLRGPDAFDRACQPGYVDTVTWIESPRMFIKPLFSRSLLIESRATHSKHVYGEDAWFVLKLLASGGRLLYVPLALYDYRVAAGSASDNPQRFVLLRDVLRRCASDFKKQPRVQAALREKIGRLYKQELYPLFLQAIKQMRLVEAGRLFLRYPQLLTIMAKTALRDLLDHLRNHKRSN